MGVEIERKFLVQDDSWGNQQKGPAWRYTQGYLSFGGDVSPEVRVRLATTTEARGGLQEQAWLTVKSKGDVSRQEIEFGIDADRARELLSACVGSVIQKVRHNVREANGYTFEVDVYEGALAGLVVAEIELPSEDAPFDRSASFLGEEITKDKSYKNAALARDGSPASSPRRMKKSSP